MFFLVLYSFFFLLAQFNKCTYVRYVCMYVYERDYTYIHVRAIFSFSFPCFQRKKKRKKREEEGRRKAEIIKVPDF